MIGTVFLVMGFNNLLAGNDPSPIENSRNNNSNNNGSQTLEYFILGFLLFIPGSYHTFLTVMTWLNKEGYSYSDVSAFENDDFHDDE